MMFGGIPNLLVLVLAIALDLTFGEPPNPMHPVVWMGKFIALLMKARVERIRSHITQFLYGVAVVLVTVGVFSAAAFFLLRWLAGMSPVAYVLVGGVLLKTTFSLRGLHRAAEKVRDLLAKKKLPEARSAVLALVGRNTCELNEGQVVSATIESVAENSCDSFVAPLFFFLILGLPGAVAYRAINTLDNSIGFRGQYEYLGKFAARLDDLVNFIPARVTALLFVAASWMGRHDPLNAWHIMLRDRGQTSSINGGWTMGAMAGGLGVKLEKVGHYKLGNGEKPLLPSTIDAALNIMVLMAFGWTLITALGEAGYYVAT